jgi:hypothetical protein
MKNITLLLILFVSCCSARFAFAQCACTSCDFVIDANTSDTYLFASEILEEMPPGSTLAGKKICIKGTINKGITLRELIGTASAPITITNCDGLAEINAGTASPINVWDSQYVKILGNSCSGIKYGIRAKGAGNFVEVKSLTIRITDIEVAWLNVGGDTGFPGSAGIKIIDEPGCDQDTLPRSHPNRWIIRNVLVHDNYVHNVGGEGMYLGKGDEAYGGKPITCGGASRTARSASLQHVRVYNNIIRDVGWDGLQLKDADLDVKVHNNTITGFGLIVPTKEAQNEGLYLGSGTIGEVYHNRIINGTGNGFQYMGAGNLHFHNNIISNVGERGIWGIGKFYEIPTNSYIRFMNNTIVKVGTRGGDQIDGVFWQQYREVDEMLFVNNIIAEIPTGGSTIEYGQGDPAFDPVGNNLFKPDATDVMFAQYAEGSDNDFLSNDYRLLSGSPAINTGTNTSIYNADSIAFDFNAVARGYNNSNYEIGAYEFTGGVINPPDDHPWAVFINVGQDTVIQSTTSGTITWAQDKQTGAHPYYNTAYNTLSTGSATSFSETRPNPTIAPAAVLGSYRYTSGSNTTISYNIPVPESGASYEVELFFAFKNSETYTANQRKFNILLEGGVAKQNYDVFTEAGTGASSFKDTIAVHDGVLQVTLVAVANAHAQLNGIAVKQHSTAPDTGDDTFVAINTGGQTFPTTPGEDIQWEEDRQTAAHAYLDDSYASLTTGSFSTFGGVNETDAPDEVVGSYRYTSGSGNRTIKYEIPVTADGEYRVQLFFARKSGETWQENVRKFDISIEDATVEYGYDVYVEAGNNAVSRTFYTQVDDDILNLAFIGVGSAHAQINGIIVDGPIQTAQGSSLSSLAAVTKEMTAEGSVSESLSIFPNPASSYFEIQTQEKGVYSVSIYSSQFQPMSTVRLQSAEGSERHRVDISALPDNRLYFISVQSGSGPKKVFRLLKRAHAIIKD